MIPIAVGRAGVDCDRPHRHARGMNSLALLVQEALSATRTAATSTCSEARAAS